MATAIHCRNYDFSVEGLARNTGPRCAVGVDLSADGAAAAAGCWKPAGGRCALREPYTAQEIADAEAEYEASSQRVAAIMPLIPRTGDGGEFVCPACKTGMVQWARARSNGHVRAACTTPNCFAMIE